MACGALGVGVLSIRLFLGYDVDVGDVYVTMR